MKKRSFLISFLVGFLAVIILSTTVVSSDFSEVPEVVKGCIPGSGQVVSSKLVITVPVGAQTYYLLSAYQENNPYPSDLVISVEKQRCRYVFYNPTGDTVSFEPYVGQEVARQFAREQIRRDIQAIGSKEKYQQELLQIPAAATWTPERVWVLRQMGFHLPKEIQIIAPEKF